MWTFRQCNEWIVRRLAWDAICHIPTYSAMTWRTTFLTGPYRALQNYISADSFVQFDIGFLREMKHPTVFISRTWSKLGDYLKFFNTWRYKISFNCASIQSERMELVWKQHGIVNFDTLQLTSLHRFCNFKQTYGNSELVLN